MIQTGERLGSGETKELVEPPFNVGCVSRLAYRPAELRLTTSALLGKGLSQMEPQLTESGAILMTGSCPSLACPGEMET